MKTLEKTFIIGLAMLTQFALASSPDVSNIQDFLWEREALQDGAVSRYSDPSGSRRILAAYYEDISLKRGVFLDYQRATEGLDDYLSDVSALLDEVPRNHEMLQCLLTKSALPERMEEYLDDALTSKENLDAAIGARITLSSGRSLAASSESKELRELKDNLKKIDSMTRRFEGCCVDPASPSRALHNSCTQDFAQRLSEIKSKDYADVNEPTQRASNPIADTNMSPEELAFFIQTDPVLIDAINRAKAGDSSHLASAWNHIQSQCTADMGSILSEEVKRRRKVKQLSEIAHAVQCTWPSIAAHRGSFGMFQASLAAASVPIKNEYVQFGCNPQMLQALSQLRTRDHALLTERWGTDDVLPQWVIQNYNDIPIQRRSYATRIAGGWATSQGFIPDVPNAPINTQGATRDPASTTPPFIASNVPVTPSTSRSFGSSSAGRGVRIAPSRGGSASGGRRSVRALSSRNFVNDSQGYSRGVRALASNISQGQRPLKSARGLAQGSASTRSLAGGISRSLSSRGASSLRVSRRGLASQGRSGVRRLASSRGMARAARSSASGFGNLVARLRRSAPSNPGGNSSPAPSPQNNQPNTNTVANNQNNQNNNGLRGNGDWDQGGAAVDPWASLRATQRSLDSQIEAKDQFIDSLVTRINEAAQAFAQAKREVVTKYNPTLINTKIEGKTSEDIVRIMGQVRQESFRELTHLGALNARVQELKTQLIVEESGLSNLLMMRGAAAGQVSPFNRSSIQPQGFANVNLPQGNNLNLPQFQNPNGQNPFNGLQNSPGSQPRNPAGGVTNPFLNQNSPSNGFGWNLMEWMLPTSWAAPSATSILESFAQWSKAVLQYHRDLESFAEQREAVRDLAKQEFLDGYRLYFDQRNDPEQMTEIRSDLATGMFHYAETVEEETSELLVKLNKQDSAEAVDLEILSSLEKAKNDAKDSKDAIVDALRSYAESYPEEVENHPEMWWSQASKLLLY